MTAKPYCFHSVRTCSFQLGICSMNICVRIAFAWLFAALTSALTAADAAEASGAGEAARPTGKVQTEVYGRQTLAWPRDFPDPTVWQAPDGTFRAAATSQKILKSRDFFCWEDTGRRIFSDGEYERIRKNWKWIWAPEAFKIGDEYLMYVSLVNSARDSAIAVYSSKDPEGPFVDGRIITRSGDTGIKDTIDPEIVRDLESGELWMFFGSTGKMHRIKLSDDGKSVAEGAKYEHIAGLTDTHSRSREKVFEGASLKWRNGWWYLFASKGWYMDHTYGIVVGRARTLSGPFRDRKGRLMKEGFATAVHVSRKGDRLFGPGHNGDIFTIGGCDYIPYHCHLAGERPKERIMLIGKLLWDDEGWPHVEK